MGYAASSMEVSFRFWGDRVKVNVIRKEDSRGVIYPVYLNDIYQFTIYYTENSEWQVLGEANGKTPVIDHELLSRILKPLESKWHDAA